MNDIEEKLMNSLNGLLENNIEAINVRIFGTRDRKSVQIIIESDDGITVESCSNVTRIAQNIIKLENLMFSLQFGAFFIDQETWCKPRRGDQQ